MSMGIAARRQFQAQVVEETAQRVRNICHQSKLTERRLFRRPTDLPHRAIAFRVYHCIGSGAAADKFRPVLLLVVQFLFPGYIFMPKLKTHKGASKRFKKTGTGKVVRQHAFARHILTSKSRKRKNKLHTGVVADESDQAKLQRMIPY